eukprot:COSAG02_NODE_7900_length_2798_cov_21.351053_1_plen_413_part_00
MDARQLLWMTLTALLVLSAWVWSRRTDATSEFDHIIQRADAAAKDPESFPRSAHTWRWEAPGNTTHFVALRHGVDDVRILLDGEEARRWPSSSMKDGQRLPLKLDNHEGSLVVNGEQTELGFSLAMPGGVFTTGANTSLLYRGCADCLGDGALESPVHFIHIPKCAGTTIEEIGCGHGLRWGKCSARASEGTINEDAVQACSAWHRPLRRPRLRNLNNGDDGVAQEPSFCVMREPFDRLLSEFRFRVTRDEIGHSYNADGLSAWISELAALPPTAMRGRWDCHLIPQSEFMLASVDDTTTSRSAGLEELCTHVLDFAHLEQDFNALMQSELYRLPIVLDGFRRNVSPRSGKANTVRIMLTDLNDAARQWIEHIYRVDFALYHGLRRRRKTGKSIGGPTELLLDDSGKTKATV